LDVDKNITGNETALRAKVTRAQHMFYQEENIKCAHDAIKATIGLQTVNPNIMLMGGL
jgi:hypothetical protein